MSLQRTTFLTASRNIEQTTQERPTPAAGEVLVELSAVGVCGSDVHWYLEGHIGTSRREEPLTLGHEPAGRVIGLGEGVDDALLGKRVAIEPAIHCGVCPFCREGHTNLCPHGRFMGTPPTQGAFCETVAHPAHLVVALPDCISDEVGSLLEPLSIGVHVSDLLAPKLGKSIVILGAGPIGLSVLMALKHSAPEKLIVVEPLAYRREMALAMGADVVLSPKDPDVVAEVARLTGGYGAHQVIEAAGPMESFDLMVKLARPGGRVAVIGIEPNDHFGFNHSVARRKGLSILMVRRSRHTLERTIAMVAGGYMQPEALITHRRGLGDLAPTMEMIAGYEDGVIKAMIDPRK